MDASIVVLVLGVPVVLAIIGLTWWFSAEQVAKRALSSLPASPVAGLRPGERVKVTGRVLVEQPVSSPFLEVGCACWVVRIEEHSGKNQYRERARVMDGRAFWLVDEAGDRIRVDARGARLVVQETVRGSCGTLDDATPVEQGLLIAAGVDGVTALGFNRSLRFQEGRLDDGERVSVSGEVRIGEGAGEVFLSLVAPAGGELLISDHPDVHG